MPNTLAHFGAQGPLTRLYSREVDARWLLLGCIVPDIPWIIQRAVVPLGLPLPAYETRLYFMAQASLLCSLVLCAALAVLSARFRVVFAILAVQATLHLLLDAAQTKWGNGAHILVPIYWKQINFGWFWPENPITYVLVILGVAFVLREWVRGGGRPVPPRLGEPAKLGAAFALLAAYAFLPLALMGGLEASDSHSIRTLREKELRPGREAAFDRVGYSPGEGAGKIGTFGGEEIVVVGPLPREPGVVSLRGTFTSPDTLLVSDAWVHRAELRAYFSYAGLALLVLFWLFPPGAEDRPGESRERSSKRRRILSS